MIQRYLLTIELRDNDLAPLRQLLKRLKRSLGIRCVAIRPVEPPKAPIPAAEAQGDENRATRLRQDASKAASMASDTFQVSGS